MTTDLVSWTHVVLDGSMSDAGSAFWAGALNGSWRSAAPSAALAASLVPVDGDTYVHRAGRGRAAPALVLEVDDVETSMQRLLALGATGRGPDALHSPGGLTFDLVEATEHRRAPATRWPDSTSSRLVQVCLDCPPDLALPEAEFWSRATGWPSREEDEAELLCHLIPASGSLQLLVQRRYSTLPREVTLHLDLGASDRDAEAARLAALGAHRIGGGDGWIVLTDPDGRAFCATGQRPEAP